MAEHFLFEFYDLCVLPFSCSMELNMIYLMCIVFTCGMLLLFCPTSVCGSVASEVIFISE
jgi:hypothetical protein